MRQTTGMMLLTVMLLPAAARAQDAALDDKLRDLLHQSTAQLRAAEDNAATLQTQLDAITKQRDQLQQQLAAAPPKPATPAPDLAAAQAAQAELAAARAQNARLAAGAAHLQAAYAQATDVARSSAAADEQHTATLKQVGGAYAACNAANGKLIALSDEILHLYETPKFRELLVANHDRLLGFKRVELQNLVQDYEDKIEAATYVPAAASPAP